MASRQDWLDAGLAILAKHGAPGLTIERLMARMRLTKGSFYHHFKGMPGFKTALLDHFETELTTRYIDVAEQDDPSPREKLQRLVDLVAEENRPDPDVAIRAWAMQDGEVRAMLQRVDRTRIDYLRTVWHQLTGDRAQATVMARLLYLIMIGAGHVLPPVDGAQLREIYALATRDALLTASER
ncbi:MAG: TetR/AcrR family transcriptional regulator [Micromonosporaceae bacterium]